MDTDDYVALTAGLDNLINSYPNKPSSSQKKEKKEFCTTRAARVASWGHVMSDKCACLSSCGWCVLDTGSVVLGCDRDVDC